MNKTLTIHNRITGETKTFAMGATSRGRMAPGVRFHADKRRATRSEDRRALRRDWRDE